MHERPRQTLPFRQQKDSKKRLDERVAVERQRGHGQRVRHNNGNKGQDHDERIPVKKPVFRPSRYDIFPVP